MHLGIFLLNPLPHVFHPGILVGGRGRAADDEVVARQGGALGPDPFGHQIHQGVADSPIGGLVHEDGTPGALGIGVGVPGENQGAALPGAPQRAGDGLRVVGSHRNHVEALGHPPVDHLDLVLGAGIGGTVIDELQVQLPGRFPGAPLGGFKITDPHQLGDHGDPQGSVPVGPGTLEAQGGQQDRQRIKPPPLLPLLQVPLFIAFPSLAPARAAG